MRIEIGIGIPSGWGEVKEEEYEYECYTDFKYVPHMYIHLLMPFCHCLHYTSTHFRHWTVAAMQSTHTHIVTHTHTHTRTYRATIQLKLQLLQHFFQHTRVYLEVFIEFTSPLAPSTRPLPTPPTLLPALGQHNWPGQLVPRSRLVALCRDIRFQIPFLRSIFFPFLLLFSISCHHSYMHACWRSRRRRRKRGDQGCQVATCRATALSFDLGFAFFTRCGPLTD